MLLRELPYELRECIAQSLLNKLSVDRHLDHGPLLLHAILGPGSLGDDDGDAWRLVATWFRFPHKRSDLWPTWYHVVEELRRERAGVADMEEEAWPTSLEDCVRKHWPLLLSTLLDWVVKDPEMRVTGPPSRQAFANSTTDTGLSLLDLACVDGRARTVKVLIDARADVQARDTTHYSPLAQATSSQKLDVVRLLLDAGADVDGCNRTGATALTVATYLGDVSAVRLLLDANANVNAVGGHGETPLFVASDRNWPIVVQTLLDAGADVTVRNMHGSTVIELLRHFEPQGRILPLLEAAERKAAERKAAEEEVVAMSDSE